MTAETGPAALGSFAAFYLVLFTALMIDVRVDALRSLKVFAWEVICFNKGKALKGAKRGRTPAKRRNLLFTS
jgi:hypothetical protein